MSSNAVDARPPGMTDKQDAIIQHVAEYVVSSCDSAKYQHKLRAQTRHNAYFTFLDVGHAYHSYYEYLLQSYKYWKDLEAAAQASGGTVGLVAGNAHADPGYDYYQQQLLREQQQQQQQQHAMAYTRASASDASSPPAAAAAAVAVEGGYYNANISSAPLPVLQHSNMTAPQASTHAPRADAVRPDNNNNDEDDDEDDEDEYELVVENGVQRLVPRRR